MFGKLLTNPFDDRSELINRLEDCMATCRRINSLTRSENIVFPIVFVVFVGANLYTHTHTLADSPC